MSANLAMPMRIMMPACILLMSFSVWTYSQRDSIGFYLNLMALLLIIISLVITIVVEVPIIKQIEKWTAETVPSNMAEIQSKWLKFHVLRTFSAITSFAAFVASILLLK